MEPTVIVTYPDGYVGQDYCNATLATWDPFQGANSAWHSLEWCAYALREHEACLNKLHMCAAPYLPRPFTDYPEHDDAMLNVDDAFDAMQV